MASSAFKDYMGVGTIASRPTTPSLATGVAGYWYATDTGVLSVWTGAAWVNVASGTSGGPAWALLNSWDFSVSGAITALDTTSLSVDEVLIITDGLTKASASVTTARLSTDNGVSYYATSGNYFSMSTLGAPSNTTGFDQLDASTSARSVQIQIGGLKNMVEKVGFGSSNVPYRFVASPSTVNAVRVTTAAGVSLNGGKIWVYGR